MRSLLGTQIHAPTRKRFVGSVLSLSVHEIFQGSQRFLSEALSSLPILAFGQIQGAGPVEECREFAANGGFPPWGPVLGIQIDTLMASDFGPTPGLRGNNFPNNVSDNGGWDASDLWA